MHLSGLRSASTAMTDNDRLTTFHHFIHGLSLSRPAFYARPKRVLEVIWSPRTSFFLYFGDVGYCSSFLKINCNTSIVRKLVG